MSLKEFRIISKLGEGAYSNVFKVRRIEDNEDYALKKVLLNNLNEKEKQNALNEVRILASIRHPYIITYKEAFIDSASNSLCIVMELAENGDLFQKIQKCLKTSTYIKELDIMKATYQLASALKALHELKVFHRDLKTANVFMQQNGDVKLGDMNVSKVAKKGLLYTQTGTPYYASPEVWKDQPYDQKSDIWSLGCVVYEMSALRPPFKADDMEGLYKKVIRGLYPRVPTHYSQDLSNIIRMMLQVSTNLRPTTNGIIELPYFQKFRNLFYETEEHNKLLNTIIFPKNPSQIISTLLPKPNYSPLKQKTEIHQSSDNQELIPRKRHLTTLGNSQKSSPNPNRISQHQYQFENDLLAEQYSVKIGAGRYTRKVHQSEQNVLGKALVDYQREINRVEMQSKPKYRRISQEDIQKRKQATQLPHLEDISPNNINNARYHQQQQQIKNARHQSVPSNNLPLIAQ